VQVFNAIPHEEKKFFDRVDRVLALAWRGSSSSVALDGAGMLRY
jgi:hypothetical protein